MRIIILALFVLIKGLIAIGDGVIWATKKLAFPFLYTVKKLTQAFLAISNTFRNKRFSVFYPLKWAKAKYFTFTARKEQVLLLHKKRKKLDSTPKLPSLTWPFTTLFSFFKRLGKTILHALPSFPHIHLSLPKFPKKPVLKHKKVSVATKKAITKPSLPFSHLSFIVKFKYFFAGAVFSLLFLFLPLLSFIYIQDLPNPKALSLGEIPQTTKIYDRHGTLLYQIYAGQNRTLVHLTDIPDYLQKATIATEDKDFYHHPGFDISAIIRSAVGNAKGENLQGGSTLTQQLIKSSLLTPETSISRKVKEAILAFWAERIYTKNQILEMYFNQIPYGGTAWGAEAAAEVYFDKHVKDLDLAQSAFLAGIPQAPTAYSPYGPNPLAWKKRQKEVLTRMVLQKYITQKQADEAYAQTLTFNKPQTPIHAPHFVMYVKDYLAKKYGLPAVERGGLTVITSLDLSLQEKAQEIVANEVSNDAYLNLTNGAALVVNPKNGDILAMVGSRDYDDPNGGANNLTTALRQPGSSIKTLTYSAALSMGVTAATIIQDSPTAFGTGGGPVYTPVNYDGKFHGSVPFRQALANSYNIPAVKMLNQVGIPTMIDLGRKMGMKNWKDPSQYGLSITLGAAEATMIDMASLYATEANQGVYKEINPLIKVTDGKGNMLFEKEENPQGQRVLDAGVAYIISHILADNSARSQAFGPNSILNIPGKTVSVKTGTTDWKKDNWTIGYTPSFVVAVWVGNNDNSPMSQSLASGVTGAAPIWNKIMTTVLKDKADETYPLPENVIQKPCLGRNEYFIRGTENTVNCAFIPRKKEEKKPDTH
jgi:1A family penicillin-binding protein